MARLERLRWIPMLFKAYHQAQLRIDSASAQLQKSKSPLSPTKQKIRRQTQPVRKRAHQQVDRKTANHKKQQFQADQSSRWINPAPGKLLREIRLTNRQLESLSEIQQQLKSIDASLEQFKQRMEELKTVEQPTRPPHKEPPPPYWPH